MIALALMTFFVVVDVADDVVADVVVVAGVDSMMILRHVYDDFYS